jgi:hypothetical protein
MIVDPWGVVINRLLSGPGAVIANIKPRHQLNLRNSLPALNHRILYRR